nr:MAG: ORF1 [Torque teno midi virus]
MPFWWRRRRRPWYTNNYRNRRRRRWPKRRRRRIYKRRRATRPRKRRRRRRYKVRKKRRLINVKQWQPESIRNCKIKGLGTIVLGAEGTQMDCYTVNKTKYVPPKVPQGGGFGVENYTLGYLYEQYTFHNNIWSASNILKDLVRYMWCSLTFYRHQDTDFIITYNNQPPHDLTKFTYPGCHPHQMLLNKHKKILLSRESKPNGKYYKKIKIKPPKQMLTKWFFTKPFCNYSLFLLKAVACNFRYSLLSRKGVNMLVNAYSLNLNFYQNSTWAQKPATGGYLPYPTVSLPLKYVIQTKTGEQEKQIDAIVRTDYSASIKYDTGWFQPSFLQAKYIGAKGSVTATHQIISVRYNPAKDDGEGNEIYCTSTLSQGWKPPTTDKQLLLTGIPIWLALHGYYSYVRTVKTEDFFKSHVVVCKSPAFYCYPEVGSCDRYVFIDYEYIQGKKPFEQLVTTQQKSLWYPDMSWQKQTLNNFVESGPYIPKYSEETASTWELNYWYNFYFKWGGPHTGETDVTNPKDLPTYDVPDTMPKTIQIANPEKNSTESILHPWDFRRGLVKESALKRMYENQSTDTEFKCSQTDIPKKKKRKGAHLRDPQEETQKIQSCLLSLCEKSTFQETPKEDQDLQLLIQHQQQQQQQLKYNILQLLMDLKDKQRMLQLQAGYLD